MLLFQPFFTDMVAAFFQAPGFLLVDLIARAEIPESYKPKDTEYYIVGQINLIIECKNLPDHGWVFFKGATPDLVIPDSYRSRLHAY
jgi:hypothetical protein